MAVVKVKISGRRSLTDFIRRTNLTNLGTLLLVQSAPSTLAETPSDDVIRVNLERLNLDSRKEKSLKIK